MLFLNCLKQPNILSMLAGDFSIAMRYVSVAAISPRSSVLR
jgi:hypothetical protein